MKIILSLLLLASTQALAADPYKQDAIRSIGSGADERVLVKINGHSTDPSLTAQSEYQALVDSLGRLYTKTDITSSALPSGAATSAKQDAQTALLTSIYADMATAAKQDIGNASLAAIDTDATTIIANQTNGTQNTVSAILEISGSGSALNATPITATDVSKYKQIGVRISGTFTATYAFEGSFDNVTYFGAPCEFVTTVVAIPFSTGQITDASVHCGIVYKYFRVRLSAYTSGTVTAQAMATTHDSMSIGSRGSIHYNSVGGLADFGAGTTNSLTTPRVTANITRNGTEWTYNKGAASANSPRVAIVNDQDPIPVTQSGAWSFGRTWTLDSSTDSVTVIQGTNPWVISNVNLDSPLSGIKTDTAAIASSVAAIDTDTTTLIGHVDGLETLVTSTNTKLDTVNSNLVTIQGKQDTGNTSLASIDTDTTTIATQQTDGSQKTKIVDGAGDTANVTGTSLDVNITSSIPAGTNSIGTVSTKTALTANSPTSASVGVTSAQALASNSSRKGLILTNVSINTIACAVGATATLTTGVVLYPGGTWSMDEYSLATGAINCIASLASSTLAIQEFQ